MAKKKPVSVRYHLSPGWVTIVKIIVGGIVTVALAYIALEQKSASTHREESEKKDVAVQIKDSIRWVADTTFQRKSAGRWIKVDSNFAVVNKKLDSLLSKK